VETDPDPQQDREPLGHARTEGDQSNRPLIALLVFIALAVAGWFVVRAVQREARLQDCVMSGRKNCAPIESATGR
jgi:hypothetical protein